MTGELAHHCPALQAHLAEIYDVDVSPDLISRITDAVHAEVAEWQARPLDRVCPVEGRKEVRGIWVETTEGAKFWLRVLNELLA